jgi:hypothetical protein
VTRLSSDHHPRIVHRHDGRWEVRCSECQGESSGEPAPLGIGLPIVNQFEAQNILANHSRGTGSPTGRRVA